MRIMVVPCNIENAAREPDRSLHEAKTAVHLQIG